jgi:redox-regulated HSP33 family molecular chaperone
LFMSILNHSGVRVILLCVYQRIIKYIIKYAVHFVFETISKFSVACSFCIVVYLFDKQKTY